jgi:hypothetical protein
MLLGAGSERLSKEPKRELALRIVQITSALIDEVLRKFPKVEFEELKAALLSEDQLREMFNISEGEAIDPEVPKFVSAIVDAYEFSLLGFPIRAMFEHLGNSAGHAVLRPSVSSVSTDHPIEDLIARVWAAEIDAVREKPELLRAIRKLPPTRFLRVSLSVYFMMRVFWTQWEQGNRLALLDAADETLGPISNGKIDKGRIQRLVKSSAEQPLG